MVGENFYASALGALESFFKESKSSRYRAGPLPAVLFSEISTYLAILSHAVPPESSSRDARYSDSSFLFIALDNCAFMEATLFVRWLFLFDCCSFRKSRRLPVLLVR